MKKISNFYNLLCQDLMSLYFPNVSYHRDNETSQKMTYQIELFNNGCLSYDKLATNVSKLVNDSKEKIEKIIDKYLVD